MPSPTPATPEDAAMHDAMQRAIRDLLSPTAPVPAYPVAHSSAPRSSARPAASAGRALSDVDDGAHAVQSAAACPSVPAVSSERRNEMQTAGHLPD